MRKLIFIFSILLAFVSCSRIEIDTVEGGRQIEDGMLLVDFSIKDMPLHSGTKALSADPEIRSLKIVVFDNHGVYISQSDATLINVTTTDGITTGFYSAHFPVSDKNETRIIHFIANYNGDLEYGTELEVISKITVCGDTDCYWQRVEVDNLMAVEQDGNMVLINQNSLKDIVLIRNFCAFTVSASNTSNLEIVSAAIYNVPDKGTIAPYSSDNSSFVGGNGFVTDYQSYTSPESLIAAGYKASVPLNYDLTKYSNSDVMTNSDGTSVKLFAYEREVPLNDPPFILVSGKWGTTPGDRASASITYYKINLRDVNDNYFPLLRNFDYKIEILEVRREGDTDIQEALKSAGSGEISTDIRFGNLTEISNGEAQIMVTTTDMVLVSGDPVQVKYKFIPDISSDTPENNNVSIILGDPGLTGAVFNSLADIQKASDDDLETGWRTITLDPNAPGDSPRRQSVTIVGRYTIDAKEHTISRTINFTLRNKPEFTLECVDGFGNPISMIAATKETPFTLKIGIPGGLPSSMFPLELAIEARERSISPDMSKANNNLPVISGKSIFDNSSAPSFHFIKTLQYSEYNDATLTDGGYKYFYAHFKSNIDLCATEIIVKNKFFNDKTTFLESTAYWTLTFNQGTNGKIFYDADDTPSALACGTGAAGIPEEKSRWVIENAGNNKYRLRIHNTQTYIQSITGNTEQLKSGDKSNSALIVFYVNSTESSFRFNNKSETRYAIGFDGINNAFINRWSGQNGTHGGAWNGGNAGSAGNLINVQRNNLDQGV